MSERQRRINEEVKKFDSRLYVYRASNGMLQVHRKADRLEASDLNQSLPDVARLNPQFILALTHDWTLQGRSVDWGLEPIMQKLRSMDSWTRGDLLPEMRARREAAAEDKQRQNHNELRAISADIRKDFARATNDINTSGI